MPICTATGTAALLAQHLCSLGRLAPSLTVDAAAVADVTVTLAAVASLTPLRQNNSLIAFAHSRVPPPTVSRVAAGRRWHRSAKRLRDWHNRLLRRNWLGRDRRNSNCRANRGWHYGGWFNRRHWQQRVVGGWHGGCPRPLYPTSRSWTVTQRGENTTLGVGAL